MIRAFTYQFEELGVIPADLYDLMGFEEDLPEPFPEMIAYALSKAPQLFNISGGFKRFESIEVNLLNETLKLENELFHPSKIVTTQLRKSSAAALFVCTAGEGISNHAAKTTKNDPVLAYIFDVLGSVTVEKAMDNIQMKLNHEVKQEGMNISDRYSPGYCNWSVSEQQKLFSLLPNNFCGVTLSASSLMHPIKSVSGIIGIGSGLTQKGYQCKWCSDTNCIFRRIKRTK
ncbi:methionine synthase [Maribellus sp. CM-23]|uniref:vitamin B12 dependent-methionine synthase activation domain-containing protein n=1 Tax=Maribellus sp. CM-23 TaxID=2781026 RepID=UPI001F2D551D|nr:vitamin B12 dependent-methionine synthase activation domain-containing protein [Maribellus sp. CM-23]MCE4563265.1 methionine synthase [Maribellus sp. CM-23]